MEWAWACPSAGRSSRRIEAACGPAGIPPFKAQPFGSLYRQRHSTVMRESSPIVYVVDDEPSVCLSLKRLLRSVGLEARTFGSALEFLHSKRPDAPGCLVLDVRLPGLSGLDLQAELAARKITLPIIFVTGHGDIPMSVRAMKAGRRRVPHQALPGTGTAGSNPARDRPGRHHQATQRGIARVAGALCVVDPARTRSLSSRDQRFVEQANRRGAWAPAKRPSRFIAGR